MLPSAILAAGVAATTLVTSEGHIYTLYPPSRPLFMGPMYKEWDFETPDGRGPEYCPACMNAKGPKYVKERAIANTDPAVLAEYGNGEWPLKWAWEKGELADNGNYLENDEIAKRHGICGDPKQDELETDYWYSTPNSDWPILETVQQGQVLEIKLGMNANHWGHCEFFICNADELEDPDGIPTQACFNENPLTRAADDGDASPIDPAYTGRYYVDPECREFETDQTIPEDAQDAQVMTARYQLPSDLTCNRCILQMVYYTGNGCKHEGYEEFNPPSWPSECAPDKEDWIELERYKCGEGGGDDPITYPEEFWGCSDFSIVADGTSPSPIPPPVTPSTPAPAATTTTTSPVASPAPEPAMPVAPPTPEPAMPVTPSTSAPTVAATMPATEPPADGPVCSDGTPGIESYGGACCVAACGQCGGMGCSTVAKDLGLGSDECCEGTILLADEPCGEAPCVVGDLLWPTTSSLSSDDYDSSPLSYSYSFDMDPWNDDDFSSSYSFDMEDDDGLSPMEPTSAPATGMPEMPPLAEGVCSNGARGIESKGACCVFECGQCGGSGCSTVGESLGLGAADCCEAVILENDEPCGEAPCVVGDGVAETDPPASPTPTTTAPPASETPAPLVATPSEECSGEDPVPAFEQCGGNTWKGSTCCDDGLECVVLGKGTCYSQCRPIDDTGSATPSPVATVEPIMPVAAPTAEPVMPVATPAPVATVAPVMPVAPPTAEPTAEPVMPVVPPTAEPTAEPVRPVAPPNDDDCRAVVIEAEDIDVFGSWAIHPDGGASGGEYISWGGLSAGKNNRNADDGDILSTSVRIDVPGTYSFKWRMRQPSGVDSDKGNDSWLYFPDATRFGPKGTEASYGTFVKVYGRANKGDFEYSGTAEDSHGHTQIAVEFAEAGNYRMEIAGRSHGHEIDQIVLFGGKIDGDDVKADDVAAGCPP